MSTRAFVTAAKFAVLPTSACLNSVNADTTVASEPVSATAFLNPPTPSVSSPLVSLYAVVVAFKVSGSPSSVCILSTAEVIVFEVPIASRLVLPTNDVKVLTAVIIPLSTV